MPPSLSWRDPRKSKTTKYIKFDAVLNQAEVRLNQLKDLVLNAQYHRLSMSWSNQMQLRDIYHAVNEQAASVNVMLWYTKPSDL